MALKYVQTTLNLTVLSLDGDKLMHWIYLTLAIAFEVTGTTCMKLADGFSRLVPSVLMGVCYVVSFTLLTFALKKVDMSIAYAIWA